MRFPERLVDRPPLPVQGFPIVDGGYALRILSIKNSEVAIHDLEHVWDISCFLAGFGVCKRTYATSKVKRIFL